MKYILKFFIRAYRFILSPFMGNQCRFHPTCSVYAEEALDQHGTIKGSYLAVSRILNCQPYSSRPFEDKVPKRFAWKDAISYKSSKSKNA